MEKFTLLDGLVAPLDRANVDTDQIIPKEHLKSIKRTGFATALFAAWRHDPEFVLNQARYRGATILLARRNFGCGSSREHAPWALLDYGFRALIAPSFADIFYNNCFKNGLLPFVLSENDVDRLFHAVKAFPGFRLTIDLDAQSVHTSDGQHAYRLHVELFRKQCLLHGHDDIALTLAHADEIRAFETKRLAEQPWLA